LEAEMIFSSSYKTPKKKILKSICLDIAKETMNIWREYRWDKYRRDSMPQNELHRIRPKWKYFSDEEVKGLNTDLIYKLDRAREYYGLPIVITSGLRTPEENNKIGGVENSSHLFGLGVDIKASDDPYLRERLSWALGRAGFERVGVYEKHFHADTSIDKPRPAFFKGQYKQKETL